MSNELLLFITLVVSFIGVIVFFRMWGKQGLFCWIAFASVLANIEVVKCVDIFGLSVTLGNVIYGSNFLATDIINDHWGGKESRRAVKIGFCILASFVILTQLSLAFIPNAEDYASPALLTIFKSAPQICLASLTAYLISNTLDTYTFDWIKRRTKHLWVRNNLSTITSQIVDSFVFTFLAFMGTFDFSTMVELSLTTIAIKALVAVLDTPFAYWGRAIARKRYQTTTNN